MTDPASAPAPGAAGTRGGLARMTARILADTGLPVTGPDDAHPRRILIFTPHARYTLHVSDDARAELHTDHDSPHHAADAAAALLQAPGRARHPDAAPDAGITFKGIAGMDLRAGGLHVALNVRTDDYYYDVTGDITVTNPAADAGAVHIDDRRGLAWYRDYQPRNPGNLRRPWPRPRPRPPEPVTVARDIAAAVTRAAATASPPPAASAPEGLAADPHPTEKGNAMTATTISRTVPSAGASPEELALMRRAAARLSRAPAASGTASDPDPFAALASPHYPGPPGPRATWQKFTSSGPHRCM